MDHAADKVHEQPREAVVDDVVVNAQGFPGKSHDTQLLTECVHHVAVTVWNGEVFFKKYIIFS